MVNELINRKTVAGVLVGVSALTPFHNIETVNVNQEQQKMLTAQKEKEEQEKLEQEKLRILKEESIKAEARIKDRERMNRVGFDPSDVRVPSNIKTSELEKLLEGTNMDVLAPAFVDAEKMYGVNAFILTGLVAVESGWNTSRRALEQYNLTGYAVYSDSAIGKDFLSPYDCILTTAKLLNEKYLNKKGECFNGYSIDAINSMYSSDKEWYNKIEKIGTKLLNKYQKENELSK